MAALFGMHGVPGGLHAVLTMSDLAMLAAPDAAITAAASYAEPPVKAPA